MEIRAEHMAKLFVQPAATPQAKPAQEQLTEKKQRQDMLELSQQAAGQLREPLAKKREDAREANTSCVLSPNAKEKEPPEDDFLVMSRCQKIAARILKGDTVPQKDHLYLQENQPGLYRIAIMMKRKNNDPENHKSLVEDEKHQKQLTFSELFSSSGSVPPTATPDQAAKTSGAEE